MVTFKNFQIAQGVLNPDGSPKSQPTTPGMPPRTPVPIPQEQDAPMQQADYPEDPYAGVEDYANRAIGPEQKATINPTKDINIGPIHLKGHTLDTLRPYLAQIYKQFASQPLGDQPHQRALGIAAKIGVGGYLGAQQERIDANAESVKSADDFNKERRTAGAALARIRLAQQGKTGGRRITLTPELRAQAKSHGVFIPDEVADVPEETLLRDMPLVDPAAASNKQKNAQEIGDAIMAGIQQPTFTNMREGVAELRGYLSRHNYNLAKALNMWLATQRNLSTINGTRFTLIMNASNTLDTQLGLLDEANKQLESLVPRSMWDGLNEVTVDKFARSFGAQGQDIKNAAQKYFTQAHLMVSELAQIFQAGGVPTDKAMQMAADALPINANFATMHSLINPETGIVRQDMRIRQNSIRTFVPITQGIDGANPYWEQGLDGPPSPIAPADSIDAKLSRILK